MCVWATLKYWCLTTDSLLSYYYPSMLHGGTTLLLHVFVYSWTTRAKSPSLIIAFHLSGDTETQALVLTSLELGTVVVFRYMHYCIVFSHVILVFHLLWAGVGAVFFYVPCKCSFVPADVEGGVCHRHRDFTSNFSHTCTIASLLFKFFSKCVKCWKSFILLFTYFYYSRCLAF